MSDSEPFSWPVHLKRYRITEQSLAEAYAALSDTERSWIKKNIAQLYALAPANAKSRVSTATRWVCGFQSTACIRPRDWAILLLDQSLTGPVWAVSAIVPAMTSGVPNILAVCQNTSSPSPHLLAGLELCGVDTICRLGRRNVSSLLENLAASATSGVILNPDNSLAQRHLPNSWPGSVAVWKPASPRRMGIWSETTDQWDWTTLAWNHPGLPLEVWGASPGKLPPGCTKKPGDWTLFCDQAYLAMGIPEQRLPETRKLRRQLILTPGQEGCWHWPDLTPEWFQTREMILETDRTWADQ